MGDQDVVDPVFFDHTEAGCMADEAPRETLAIFLPLFTLQVPNVAQREEATRGALSDVLAKELPNGWRLTLSNEICRDGEESLWEGRGIPPAEEVTVFDPKTIETSRLKTIRETAKAMEARLR